MTAKRKKFRIWRLLRTCLLLCILAVAARGALAYITTSLPSATPSAEQTDALQSDKQRVYTAPLAALKKSNPKIKKQIETIINNLDAYPENYLDLLLRNPETADFVAAYPNRDQLGTKAPVTVKKGELPLFLQWDQRWGYNDYGSSCIAISGCGPTSLSMVYCGLTGDASYTPDKMAAFSDGRGYYTSAGTSWKLMTEGARALGLTSSELPVDAGVMKAALKKGNPLIISVGPGDFTTEGHFLVITGVTHNGRFTVLDPNSREKTEKNWTAEKLLPQILNIWSFSKA